MTGFDVVSKVRNTELGSDWPCSVMTWLAVNGWLKTTSKYTVYCCGPKVLVCQQKSPLVTEPATSWSPITWALVPKSLKSLSSSLIRKSAWLVRGKVNRPAAECCVAVNCDVIASDPGPLLTAE